MKKVLVKEVITNEVVNLIDQVFNEVYTNEFRELVIDKIRTKLNYDVIDNDKVNDLELLMFDVIFPIQKRVSEIINQL